MWSMQKSWLWVESVTRSNTALAVKKKKTEEKKLVSDLWEPGDTEGM